MVIKDIKHYRNISTSNCFELPEERIFYYDFTFMLEGEMTYYIEGQEIVIKKNDAIFLPPGTLRSRPEDNSHIRKYVSYNFFADDMDIKLDLYLPNCITPNIKKIISLFPVQHEFHKYYTKQKCISILSYVLLEIYENQKKSFKNPHVLKIMHYVSEHIEEKLTLSKIANTIHLSKEYTSALFTKETGQTLIDYINEQKMIIASEMVKNTELSLSDIATKLGFENYHYFSRLFKKCYNTSAQQFKRNSQVK